MASSVLGVRTRPRVRPGPRLLFSLALRPSLPQAEQEVRQGTGFPNLPVQAALCPLPSDLSSHPSTWPRLPVQGLAEFGGWLLRSDKQGRGKLFFRQQSF